MTGPTEHLSWNELACWNHGPTWENFAPGELVSPYPQAWRETRASQLAMTFERVRELLGDVPITILSAYRREDYNAHVGGVKASQHIQGRALDIKHRTLPARQVFAQLLELQKAGELPLLGGLGSYRSFVHLDVRPKVGGRLATWIY
jgi:uncharacterized protein YcbK (DUF882 family)